MSETGIGARVKRKEDHRFITGKGRYTDDINLHGPDPCLLHPLAPRACEIKKIDAKACVEAAGRTRLF
jgi:carbon-monoxide dehydrogenase large subunit